ncbi:MAG: hypothetical protein HC860_01300 [Alkalinema sp. RU_4_3]|nr:hypothetical protein [Alkalinema sp. RU_4_3]
MSLKLLPCVAIALLSLTSCSGSNYQSTAPVSPTPTPELAKPSVAASPVAKAEVEAKVDVEPNAEVETKVEAPPEPQAKDRTPAQPLNAPKEIRDTPEDRNRRLEIARKMDEDVLVLKNQNRTITVRGMQAWSGKNGSGDLGYESCDIDGKCLKLQGGTVTCSRGTCGLSWSNGDYGYGLTAAMNNPDRPTPNAGYTLTVVHGGKVILEEEGLKSE